MSYLLIVALILSAVGYTSQRLLKQKTDKTWPVNTWQPNTWVGGGGGVEFNHVADMGQRVELVQVFGDEGDDEHPLRGIKVKFTNGVEKLAGTETAFHKDLALGPGETITEATVWGNGVGKRAGHIRMVTKNGQTLDFGKDVDGQDSYTQTVASGILIGFVGRAGADVDMLSPLFLKVIKDSKIHDFKYQLPDSSVVQPHVISSVPYTFTGVETDDNTFTATMTYQKGYSVTNTFTEEFTISTDFSIGVPELLQAGASFSFTMGQEQGNTLQESITLGFTWERKIPKIKSKADEVLAEAIFYQANLNSIHYDATWDFTMDGEQFSIPTFGEFSSVLYLKGETKITPLNGQVQALKPPTSKHLK